MSTGPVAWSKSHSPELIPHFACSAFPLFHETDRMNRREEAESVDMPIQGGI